MPLVSLQELQTTLDRKRGASDGAEMDGLPKSKKRRKAKNDSEEI